MRNVFKAAGVAALCGVGGCAEGPGANPAASFSLQTPGFGRTLSRDYLQIVDFSRTVVEVDANGRTVRAPAPAGYCIPREGVLTGRASVFFVMEPCTAGEPGVFSVSIGKRPLFDGKSATAESLAALGRYLKTDAGQRSLGFDSGSGAIFLVETEIKDGTLVAIVKDGSGAAPDFAAPTFAKAFTEINGRMVVATLLARKGAAFDNEALKARIAELVAGLRAANGGVRTS